MKKTLLIAILIIISLSNLNANSFDDGVKAYKIKEFKKAKKLFKKSCNGGNTYACNELAIMYDTGLGSKQDYLKALKFYTKACDGEYIIGCYNLGIMYEKGQGTNQDYYKATKLYNKSCDNGYAKGCYNLGVIYLRILINKKLYKI